MKIYANDGKPKFFLVKNTSRGRTKYWPTVEVRYLFYEDCKDIKSEYVYLTKTKRLYRFTPGAERSYVILWGNWSNIIEELTGLKKQIAAVRFEEKK